MVGAGTEADVGVAKEGEGVDGGCAGVACCCAAADDEAAGIGMIVQVEFTPIAASQRTLPLCSSPVRNLPVLD